MTELQFGGDSLCCATSPSLLVMARIQSRPTVDMIKTQSEASGLESGCRLEQNSKNQ